MRRRDEAGWIEALLVLSVILVSVFRTFRRPAHRCHSHRCHPHRG